MTRWNIYGVKLIRDLVNPILNNKIGYQLLTEQKLFYLDIDGIKICSDVEGGATRRTYNYRVSIFLVFFLSP